MRRLQPLVQLTVPKAFHAHSNPNRSASLPSRTPAITSRHGGNHYLCLHQTMYTPITPANYADHKLPLTDKNSVFPRTSGVLSPSHSLPSFHPYFARSPTKVGAIRLLLLGCPPSALSCDSLFALSGTLPIVTVAPPAWLPSWLIGVCGGVVMLSGLGAAKLPP